jgi:hypothetical protein
MLTALANLLLASALLAEPAASLEAVSGVRLRDQFGAEDSLDAHRGRFVVVMVVDAKRLRKLKPWERELRERFEQLDYLRIAEVPDDPPTTWERVADKLREQVPEGVSVLIDLENRWSTALDLDASRPNILIIDAAGRLVAAFAGPYDPALGELVVAQLDTAVAAP